MKKSASLNDKPKTNSKQNHNQNQNQNLQEIFLTEEKEKISNLLYEEKNPEFIKLFESYLNYSKTKDDRLTKSIERIKMFINKKCESAYTCISDLNIQKIFETISNLKQIFDFDNFHFVDFFIYFNQFITYDEQENNYWIDKHTFVRLNLNLIALSKINIKSINDEEYEKNIIKKIFKSLKVNYKGIDLEIIIFYLRQLTNCILSPHSLFKFLDKTNTGLLYKKDLEIKLREIEEFIVFTDEASVSHHSLDNCCDEIIKKLFFKNKILNESQLNEICRIDKSIFFSISNLYEKAENSIEKLFIKTKKKFLQSNQESNNEIKLDNMNEYDMSYFPDLKESEKNFVKNYENLNQSINTDKDDQLNLKIKTSSVLKNNLIEENKEKELINRYSNLRKNSKRFSDKNVSRSSFVQNKSESRIKKIDSNNSIEFYNISPLKKSTDFLRISENIVVETNKIENSGNEFYDELKFNYVEEIKLKSSNI